MDPISLALMGIGTLGGLFGNKGNSQNSTQKIDQTQSTDMTTRPVYDTKTAILRDYLINLFMDRAQGNDDYFQGYTAQGLQDLNKQQQMASTQIANMLAARGIRGSAAGAALANPIIAHQQGVSSFINSIPQLKDQRQSQILKDTGSFLATLPVGTNQFGTQTTKGTTTGNVQQSGNMVGGGLMNLGSMMAGLYGMGAFGNQSNKTGDSYMYRG